MTFPPYFCVFILLITVVNGTLKDYYQFKNVDVLTQENFAQYVNSSVIKSVYFYKRGHGQHNLKGFFKECDEAAAYLTKFNVKVGVLDCDVNDMVDHCANADVKENVYIFKKGKQLVLLGLETMFDLDSIVANLLQLLMLKEVLILQTVADRESLLEDNVGKRNILFSYQKAMGTYEHRIFLESAFAYSDDYTFAITTELDGVQGLIGVDESTKKKNADMWFIKCKDVKEGKTCPSTKYNGVMDLINVARYLKLLMNPIMFDLPGDGDEAVYEKQEIHLAFLMYDIESKASVMETAEKLGNLYFGTVGVVTVDVNLVNTVDRFEHNRAAYKPPVFALKLYGKKPVYMINRFSTENIIKFAKNQLLIAEKEAHKIRLGAMPGVPIPSSTDSTFDDIVQTPDDEVAESVRKMQKTLEIDLSKIPALTDKTFPEIKSKSQITLVLFYIKFDPVSMAFLRSYAEAAEMFTDGALSNPLARVDCFDWTDVCGNQNITRFPTVQIFKKDKDPVEYKGLLDGKKVLDYLRIHQVENPMKLSSKEQAMSFISGSYPEKSSDYVDVLVVAGSTGRTQELSVLQEVASEFQGQFLFAYGVDSVAKDICSKYNAKLPCVVILKHNDPLHPSKVFSGTLEPEELTEFVRKNRLPIFTELTMENFPIFYKQRKPLILFFGDKAGNPKEFKALSDVAVGGVVTDCLFAWVDVSNVDSIGTQILQTYSTDAQIPTIAQVNIVKGFVHLYNRDNFKADLIVEWIKDIEENKEWAEYIMPETKWAPLHPGYDFLNLMEKSYSNDKYLAIANENGIDDNIDERIEELLFGFDAEGNPIENKSIDDLSAEADELIGAVPSSRLARPSKAKKEKHGHEIESEHEHMSDNEHMGQGDEHMSGQEHGQQHDHMEQGHEQMTDGHEQMTDGHEHMKSGHVHEHMDFEHEYPDKYEEHMNEHMGHMDEYMEHIKEHMDGMKENVGPSETFTDSYERTQKKEAEMQMNKKHLNNNEMQDHDEL